MTSRASVVPFWCWWSVQGAAGLAGARGLVRLMLRGLGTAGPGFVVRACCLIASVVAVAAAHSRTAGALARGGRAGSAASSAECWCRFVRSSVRVDGGDRPAEAGEVAGDGDRDDGLALTALAVEATPELVEALLGPPRDRQRLRGLALLASLGRGALAERTALVPGCLDEESAGVAGAGLGDRALSSSSSCLA
jgi:hypothetical protein